MHQITFLHLLVFIFFYCQGNSQEIQPNIIGEKHTIDSKILNEKREVSIYLPENYNDTETNYPVLYILDGQRYFLNGVLYQNTLRWQEKTPDFIVVGIHTDNRKRRKLFFDDSNIFIQFLGKELISYVSKNYRTSSKRFFFGWEMAGGLGVEILAQTTNLFSAYFISSPTHLTETRLSSLKTALINNNDPAEFIYVTLSSSEDWAIKSVEQLQKILQENTSQQTKCEYQLFVNENHHSTPTLTIHRGLNRYFHDYPYLRFKSLKDFKSFGGIDKLKEHYLKRSKKYNTNKSIHKSTKHFLLLQAMKEDDYESFAFFMNEFGDYYKSKTRDQWFNRYAQFYLKHQKPSEAIAILDVGMNKFQNSSMILGTLGDAYLLTGNDEKAKRYYEKAIELALQNDDKNIDLYKSKLNGL